MITASVTIVLVLVFLAVARHIHLTTKDRLERLQSLLFPAPVHLVAVVEEFFNAEHVSMVSYSHTLHTVANSLVNEL